MNLLLTGAFPYTEEQLHSLTDLGYNTVFVQDERLPLTIPLAEIDAVVTNNLLLLNKIAEFKNLKFIQLTSAGTDRVPLEYINANNIELKTAQGVYSVPIAEWVILKILEIYKKSRQFYISQQKHEWCKQRDLFELAGKTAAIIGYGSVGVEVAKRLSAFDVTITAVDNRIPEVEEEHWITELKAPENLDAVLEKSDIVILAVPLAQQTRHLINTRRLEILKDNAVLINVSRGGIVDEKALINAMQNNKFLGVALDVFEEEPLPATSPLWDFENVLITPHNAFISDKIHNRLFELIYKNLKDFMKNGS